MKNDTIDEGVGHEMDRDLNKKLGIAHKEPNKIWTALDLKKGKWVGKET